MSNCSLVPKYTQFAYDNSITASDTNTSNLFDVVRQNLNLIDKWLVSNKLILYEYEYLL